MLVSMADESLLATVGAKIEKYFLLMEFVVVLLGALADLVLSRMAPNNGLRAGNATTIM